MIRASEKGKVRPNQAGRSLMDSVATVTGMATWSATACERTLTKPSTCRNLPRLIRHSCGRVPPPSLPSVPSVAPSRNEALYVSEEVPRGPWLFSLDCEQDSEVQDAEENHLSRADDDIVVDSGAAVSSASRTCAAHCVLKHGRQLTLQSATGHTQHTMDTAQTRCS